jgi:hypothetical protein
MLLVALLLILPPTLAHAQRHRPDSLHAVRADSSRRVKAPRALRAPNTSLLFTLRSPRLDSTGRDTTRWNPRGVEWTTRSRLDGLLAGMRAGATCSQVDLWCSDRLQDQYRRLSDHRGGLEYFIGTVIGQGLISERRRQLRLLGDSGRVRP